MTRDDRIAMSGERFAITHLNTREIPLAARHSRFETRLAVMDRTRPIGASPDET